MQTITTLIVVPAIACYGDTIHTVKKKHWWNQYRFLCPKP